MNRTKLTKKQAFIKIINYLVKDKKERKEIESDLSFYYNNSLLNHSINIARLLHCLNYTGYTINQENKQQINNFVNFIFLKYDTPADLSITYSVNFK